MTKEEYFEYFSTCLAPEFLKCAMHGADQLNQSDKEKIYNAYNTNIHAEPLEKLQAVLAAVNTLDEDSQKQVLEEVGGACYRCAKCSYESMGWKMVTERAGKKLTLAEAAEEIRIRELNNDGCRRDFETVIDGRTVTVHRREYECFADGDSIVAISAIGRLYGPGAHCSCTLRNVVAINKNYCTHCLKGHYGKMLEEMTGRKCISCEVPESPCNGGYDYCKYILHFEPEK